MTAHNNAEMVKAKAGNIDLVVLRKHHEGDWIEVADQNEIRIRRSGEYFLCLPQHKEAVLNILNGGESQVSFVGNWSDCNCNQPVEWSPKWWYMDPHCQSRIKSRIKPRKEIRHLVIHNGRLVGELFKFDSDIRASFGAEYNCLQIHRIEVEV